MTTSIPIDQLPDTFEADTTMYIGQDEWFIESADPRKKDDFKKTKKLTLVIRKIEWVDPKKLLYSLPTICNYLGDVNEGLSKDEHVLEIMEDDWRNIEFISNGRIAKSKLMEFCVYEIVPTDAIERDIDSLEKFCIENNLSIVDWCRVIHALPTTEGFRSYLTNNALTKEPK